MSSTWILFFYVLLFSWVIILLTILYQAHLRCKQARNRYTKMVKGLIINNESQRKFGYIQFRSYTIKYISNLDPAGTRHKISSKHLSLIDGYSNNMYIPFEIKTLIAQRSFMEVLIFQKSRLHYFWCNNTY